MKNKLMQSGLVYSTDPELMKPVAEPATETPAPAKQRLKVKIDTKHRGGKTVTLVEGFIGTEEDLEILGKELKTKCGTGGSAKDGLIIIQGDVKLKVLEWLQKWGYNAK